MTTAFAMKSADLVNELASKLVVGWSKYQKFFGAVPNGTEQQMRALIELSGGIEMIRAMAHQHGNVVCVPKALIDKAQAVREELGDHEYSKMLRFKGFVTDKQLALCDALQEFDEAAAKEGK